MSPHALALLDLDDQLCLLGAAGTPVGGLEAGDDDDDRAALLGGTAFSWGRRGTADLVASFKQRYPVKVPVAR